MGDEPGEGRARPVGTWARSFREAGGILPGTFRDPSGKLAGSWRDGSGTIRGRFEDGLRTLGRGKRGQTRPAAQARGGEPADRRLGNRRSVAGPGGKLAGRFGDGSRTVRGRFEGCLAGKRDQTRPAARARGGEPADRRLGNRRSIAEARRFRGGRERRDGGGAGVVKWPGLGDATHRADFLVVLPENASPVPFGERSQHTKDWKLEKSARRPSFTPLQITLTASCEWSDSRCEQAT